MSRARKLLNKMAEVKPSLGKDILKLNDIIVTQVKNPEKDKNFVVNFAALSFAQIAGHKEGTLFFKTDKEALKVAKDSQKKIDKSPGRGK